jgi:hypothetical protein
MIDGKVTRFPYITARDGTAEAGIKVVPGSWAADLTLNSVSADVTTNCIH